MNQPSRSQHVLGQVRPGKWASLGPHECVFCAAGAFWGLLQLVALQLIPAGQADPSVALSSPQ